MGEVSEFREGEGDPCSFFYSFEIHCITFVCFSLPPLTVSLVLLLR